MNTKDFYVVEVFIPTEYTMTTEMGISQTKICKKLNDTSYKDIKSGRVYTVNRIIGCTKVFNIYPLSEYYYLIGLRKNNEHRNKDEVHKLVKSYRKDKLL